MQIVVEADRDVAAHCRLRQFLMAGARAMHHHPAVRADPVDDAVVGELAGFVEHAGIGRLARVDLLDVACRGEIDEMGGMRAGDVHLLQARHVHQSGLGADREIFVIGVAGIAPGRAHAAPVLELRAERPVAVGEGRKSPGSGHL
jgi:hypothetical protein